MKVKIQNTIYDSKDQPIMIILSEKEKWLLARMPKEATKFVSFTEKFKKPKLEAWMKNE